MEERKTAAMVLSILALIVIVFTVVIPYINLKKDYTTSYKDCSVTFRYHYSVDTTEDAYNYAQNELGLCLCNSYIKKPDVKTGKKIMELYKKYGRSAIQDTANHIKYNNLDSVLKYRDVAFDPRPLWD